MYNSPITIYENIIQQEIREKEDKIVSEIKSQIAVDVNKVELIKALNYDRHQYEKGYKDGVDAERQRWINNLTDVMNHPPMEG